MKRIKSLFSFIILVLLCLTSCQDKGLNQVAKTLKATPSEVVFAREASSQTLSISTNAESWTLKIKEGDWFSISADEGKAPGGDVIVSAGDCGSQRRTGKLELSAPGCLTVSINVIQEPLDEVIEPSKKGLFTIGEEAPDADAPCTLYYRAVSGTPFFGYKQDIYAHIGIVESEWMFVQAEWNVNVDKCKWTPMAEENLWKLELKPTIREYFGSGDTPVSKIGVVVRSADGKKQTGDMFVAVKDSKNAFTPDPIDNQTVPSGAKHGINYNSDGSVTLVLYDKDKNGKRHDWCYLIGDFNDFKRSKEYAMKRDDDAGVWWYTLKSVEKGKEYLFQYWLGSADSSVKIHDPYSELVYDCSNDKYIPSSTYPGLKSPEGTSGLVGTFCHSPQAYTWPSSDFKIKDRDNLVIYELHFRDFSASSDIAGALEKLDYIQAMGVNAIELMPVQEFDGNDSWGYNPCSYFAMDKAYGTREKYKQFISECHSRGIAVLFDVVYNQATGAHPYAKMYWDPSANKTASSNPFFNVDAPHPYSVFHDWNHENKIVRDHVKRNLVYLLEEYRIDGFRFDLTKGFTNKASTEQNASNYDQSRISILKDYNSAIKAANPDAVVILEHFCETKEEKELAEDGMKLWRNLNYAFSQAAKGEPSDSDFSGLWTGSSMPFGSLVGYAESHDEERTAYNALNKGVSDVKSKLEVRMAREALNAAFLLLVPGPKMIWQFQELGYDESIETGGRTGRKPLHWEYLDQPSRKALYNAYCSIIKFRMTNPEFFTDKASFSAKMGSNNWANGRFITISSGSKSFVLAGNFDTKESQIEITFPSSATWKNAFDPTESYSGDKASLKMAAAEWKIFVNF